ncbi:MAG: hypothetical protein GTN39_01840 [Candidatus Aenigmarchaeota archaeon]|nr:hypothetical protein [Candidatus Aenigmarchaeota archaeon]
MIDERLIDYIRDNLRKGYSLDSLRKVLIDEGWDPNQVNEAINYVQNISPPASPPVPSPHPSWSPPEEEETRKPSRPTGVTIICILGFLGAILLLISGVLLVGLGGIIVNTGIPFLGNETASVTLGGFGSVLGPLLDLMGFVLIALAVIYFVSFYLLLKMNRIGFVLVILLGLLQIIGSAISFSMNNATMIVLWAIIIAYLFIKRKFFV